MYRAGYRYMYLGMYRVPTYARGGASDIGIMHYYTALHYTALTSEKKNAKNIKQTSYKTRERESMPSLQKDGLK